MLFKRILLALAVLTVPVWAQAQPIDSFSTAQPLLVSNSPTRPNSSLVATEKFIRFLKVGLKQGTALSAEIQQSGGQGYLAVIPFGASSGSTTISWSPRSVEQFDLGMLAGHSLALHFQSLQIANKAPTRVVITAADSTKSQTVNISVRESVTHSTLLVSLRRFRKVNLHALKRVAVTITTGSAGSALFFCIAVVEDSAALGVNPCALGTSSSAAAPAPMGSPTVSASRTATVNPTASVIPSPSTSATATPSPTPTPWPLCAHCGVGCTAGEGTYCSNGTTGAEYGCCYTTDGTTPAGYIDCFDPSGATADSHPAVGTTGPTCLTPTPTGSPSTTATPTTTVTATKSATPNKSPTVKPSGTATTAPSATALKTATPTATSTASKSATATKSPTVNPTGTATTTPSATAVKTATVTATPIKTPTPVNTATVTPTATETASNTGTPTATQTGTPTKTPTPTATRTATGSTTVTKTPTIAPSGTTSPTVTPVTPTGTPTPYVTSTPVATPTPGCSETDSGVDFPTKGTTTATNSSGVTSSSTDFCKLDSDGGPSDTLTEYSCDSSNAIASQEEDCSLHTPAACCADGACRDRSGGISISLNQCNGIASGCQEACPYDGGSTKYASIFGNDLSISFKAKATLPADVPSACEITVAADLSALGDGVEDKSPQKKTCAGKSECTLDFTMTKDKRKSSGDGTVSINVSTKYCCLLDGSKNVGLLIQPNPAQVLHVFHGVGVLWAMGGDPTACMTNTDPSVCTKPVYENSIPGIDSFQHYKSADQNAYTTIATAANTELLHSTSSEPRCNQYPEVNIIGWSNGGHAAVYNAKMLAESKGVTVSNLFVLDPVPYGDCALNPILQPSIPPWCYFAERQCVKNFYGSYEYAQSTFPATGRRGRFVNNGSTKFTSGPNCLPGETWPENAHDLMTCHPDTLAAAKAMFPEDMEIIRSKIDRDCTEPPPGDELSPDKGYGLANCSYELGGPSTIFPFLSGPCYHPLSRPPHN